MGVGQRIGLITFQCVVALLAFGSNADGQDLHPMGVTFLPPDRYASIPLASPPLSGPLPEAVDLSKSFPAPGDQGKLASCVGWATSYLKAYQERIERPKESNITFSSAFIYNQINKSGNCQTGTFIVDALNLITQQGAARAEHFPYQYDCTQSPSPWVRQEASQYRIAAWNRVNVQSLFDMKTHLASGFPVLVGVAIPRNFHSYMEGVYRTPQGPITGGHAMVVVGYDDNTSAYKLINSWGTNWGRGGFVHIAYDAFHTIVREGYATQDVIIPSPIVTPKQVEPQPQPTPVVVSPPPTKKLKPPVAPKYVVLNKPIRFSSIWAAIDDEIRLLNTPFDQLPFTKFGAPKEHESTYTFAWDEANLVGSYHVYQSPHMYPSTQLAGNRGYYLQWIVGQERNFDALTLLSWNNELGDPANCEETRRGYREFLKKAAGRDYVVKRTGPNSEGETIYTQTFGFNDIFYQLKFIVPDKNKSTICISSLTIRKVPM